MIRITVESKKYNCTVDIKEKVTFINGDSGVGKTEFTRRVSDRTRANRVSVSNGFNIVVLVQSTFEDICKKAERWLSKKPREKALEEYWGSEENFPYYNCIIIIDDEDFVKSRDFSCFYNCDRYNYYIIINRGKVSGISYSVDEIYDFVKDGKNHYIRKSYVYPTVNVGLRRVEDYE